MDDRIRERIEGFVRQLVQEEKATLRQARTLLDIEEQAIEIGDEIARRLANADLSERADEAFQQERFACPDCGRESPVEDDPEPLILQGRRGEIEYAEPRCHCRSCRRDFFPGGARTRASGS